VNGFSVDKPSGRILFATGATAPGEQLYADYSIQQVSDSGLTVLCKRGFNEMETRIPRGFVLFETGSEFYISSSPNEIVDPTTGGRTFSASPIQVDFFLACCELKLYESMHSLAASNAVSYREERVGGLAVDSTKGPKEWQAIIESHTEKLLTKEESALRESGIGDEYGAFIPGPYLDNGVWVEYGDS
jgi:hypothetical protein